jgi:hypothetical protein
MFVARCTPSRIGTMTLWNSAIPEFEESEVSGVWAVTQAAGSADL